MVMILTPISRSVDHIKSVVEVRKICVVTFVKYIWSKVETKILKQFFTNFSRFMDKQ